MFYDDDLLQFFIDMIGFKTERLTDNVSLGNLPAIEPFSPSARSLTLCCDGLCKDVVRTTINS